MLIQFQFQNYKSFRDLTTLDLSASEREYALDHVVSIGEERILPAAVVYGANASGKSNVMDAFIYMRVFVLSSYMYNGFGQDGKKIAPPLRIPFLLDGKSISDNSSFEVYFTSHDGEKEFLYDYGFVIGIDGIQEEWLNRGQKNAMEMVFYREKGVPIELNEALSGKRDLIEVFLQDKEYSLLASVNAMINIEQLKPVMDWFVSCQIVDFTDKEKNYEMEHNLPVGFVENSDVRKRVARYFSSFDPSITDFYVEKKKENDKFSLFSIHKGCEGKQPVRFFFGWESAGTRKMFGLFSVIDPILQRGDVLFVDELNAHLHPLLLRNVLQLFLNPDLNPNHAQIVFTSHDAWLLSSGLFRRDEVWFTEKEADGATILYSMEEFRESDGEKDWQEDYLTGKFGAIPHLKDSFH